MIKFVKATQSNLSVTKCITRYHSFLCNEIIIIVSLHVTEPNDNCFDINVGELDVNKKRLMHALKFTIFFKNE